MKVSNSELGTYRRCPRKWWLGYYRKLMPPLPEVAGARALGTRVHLALAAHYAGTGEPLEVFRLSAQEDRERLFQAGMDTKDLDDDTSLGLIMLQGYLDWVAEEGMDTDLEFLGTEQQLSAELPGTGVTLIGKLDARVKDHRTGFRYFIDHKTVGNLTQPIAVLHMDRQMLTYQLLERLNSPEGEHVIGGLYNMLRKVKRTATAKPPFYGRYPAHHNDEELRNHWYHILATVREIVAATESLDSGVDHHSVVPPNPTGNCTWDCDFFALCPMFDDGSAAEAMVAATYVVGDPYDRYNDKKGEVNG